jgi:hypothetical protein
MGLGLAFGDRFFTGFEEALGEPLDAIVMALGGAVLGGLAHELFVNFYRRR